MEENHTQPPAAVGKVPPQDLKTPSTGTSSGGEGGKIIVQDALSHYIDGSFHVIQAKNPAIDHAMGVIGT